MPQLHVDLPSIHRVSEVKIQEVNHMDRSWLSITFYDENGNYLEQAAFPSIGSDGNSIPITLSSKLSLRIDYSGEE